MYPYVYIGGIRFPLYSICVFAGAIFALATLTYFWRSKRILHIYMPSLAVGFIGLMLGAKLFGILSKGIYNLIENHNWNMYDSVFNSGIVYWGGLLGFLIVVQLNCRWRKKNFEEIADSLAVVIPLFHGFGRIGCFFAGCCYGKKTESHFWLPYWMEKKGELETRLPTQLMEAGFEFAVFAVLLVLYRKKRKESGANLVYFYLVVYSIFRFFIEFCRDDEIRGIVGGVSFSQIISLIVIISVSAITVWKRGK